MLDIPDWKPAQTSARQRHGGHAQPAAGVQPEEAGGVWPVCFWPLAAAGGEFARGFSVERFRRLLRAAAQAQPGPV